MATATWLDVLGPIPQDALEQAFGEWESEEERRPSPAAIRKRALRRIKPAAQAAASDAPFGPMELTREEIDRRVRVSEELAGRFPILRVVPKAEEG